MPLAKHATPNNLVFRYALETPQAKQKLTSGFLAPKGSPREGGTYMQRHVTAVEWPGISDIHAITPHQPCSQPEDRACANEYALLFWALQAPPLKGLPAASDAPWAKKGEGPRVHWRPAHRRLIRKGQGANPRRHRHQIG